LDRGQAHSTPRGRSHHQGGERDAFEGIAQAMVASSQKEPSTLGYEWFLSADRRRCRLMETYTDANAVLAHINGSVVEELLPKLPGRRASRASRFMVTQARRQQRCSRLRRRNLRVPIWTGPLNLPPFGIKPLCDFRRLSRRIRR
jgi:quinol monooxygenase YgiN